MRTQAESTAVELPASIAVIVVIVVDRDGRRVVVAEFGVVRESQELERGDRALGLLELGELGAFAAELVGIDAHPAVAGVEQGCAGLLCSGDFGVGDLFVADHQLPLDEGFLAELLATVVGRCGRCLARHADARADESLGPDELHPEALQFDRRDVEEVLGDVEVEFDLGGFVLEGEVGEAGDDRRDLLDRGGDQLGE